MKKSTSRKLSILLLLSFIFIPFLISCKEKATISTNDSLNSALETEMTFEQDTSQTGAESDPDEEDPEESDYAINPLTGVQNMEQENVGCRSVSIPINNAQAALPSRGVTSADVIYEHETEGGQTRLLIVFADAFTIPEVGSLRSARIIACDLSAGTNSIFFHYGKNLRVPGYANTIQLDHIDGNDHSQDSGSTDENGTIELPDNIFAWRDDTWLTQRAKEHTAVSNGMNIYKGIQNTESIEFLGETPSLFNFSAETTVMEKSKACNWMNVYFSPVNPDSLFQYNPEDQLYYKSQYGAPQKDETTGNVVAVENIFTLFANIVTTEDGTIDAYLTDGGDGYYVSKGKIIPIDWTKESANSPISIFDKAGNPVLVYPGKSYINIVRGTQKSKTTFGE